MTAPDLNHTFTLTHAAAPAISLDAIQQAIDDFLTLQGPPPPKFAIISPQQEDALKEIVTPTPNTPQLHHLHAILGLAIVVPGRNAVDLRPPHSVANH